MVAMVVSIFAAKIDTKIMEACLDLYPIQRKHQPRYSELIGAVCFQSSLNMKQMWLRLGFCVPPVIRVFVSHIFRTLSL